MTDTRIRLKHYALRIRVVDWDAEVEMDAAPASDVVRLFRQNWEQMGLDFKAPRQGWSPREEVIAKRLVEKHGLDTVLRMATSWWRRYARDQGVFDGRDQQQLVLFAATVRDRHDEL